MSRRPPTLKVSLNSIGGFRNAVTFVLTGLDIEAKAELVRGQLEAALTAQARGAGVDTGAHRPRRRRHRGGAPAHCSAASSAIPTPPSSGADSPRPQSNSRWPAIRASPPPPHPATVRSTGCSPPATCRRPRCAHVAVHPDGTRAPIAPADRDPGTGRRAAARAARAAAVRTDPAGAAGHDRRCAQRGQGRRGQRRRVGAHRRAVALAGPHADRRGVRELLPEAADLPVTPASAAEPARRQLRHRGNPRAGRRLPGALRPAGQGPRRVAAQPAHRHPGGMLS